MIALSVAKLNFFFARKRNFSLNEVYKRKVFVQSLDQFRCLEVREKVRNVFVMSLRLCDHKVLHNIASVLIKIFDFARVSRFLRSYLVLLTFWSLRNLIAELRARRRPARAEHDS